MFLVVPLEVQTFFILIQLNIYFNFFLVLWLYASSVIAHSKVLIFYTYLLLSVIVSVLRSRHLIYLYYFLYMI